MAFNELLERVLQEAQAQQAAHDRFGNTPPGQAMMRHGPAIPPSQQPFDFSQHDLVNAMQVAAPHDRTYVPPPPPPPPAPPQNPPGFFPPQFMDGGAPQAAPPWQGPPAPVNGVPHGMTATSQFGWQPEEKIGRMNELMEQHQASQPPFVPKAVQAPWEGVADPRERSQIYNREMAASKVKEMRPRSPEIEDLSLLVDYGVIDPSSFNSLEEATEAAVQARRSGILQRIKEKRQARRERRGK